MAVRGRAAWVVLVLVLGLLAVACGTPATPDAARPAPSETGEVTAVGVGRLDPTDPPLAEAVDALHAFGHRLHLEAGADATQNTVLSPLSIGVAFGMARAGAGGATAEQMDAVLGLPDGVHPAFNALERAIVTVDGAPPRPDPEATRASDDPQPPVVALANGLFAQAGLGLEAPFLATLASHYGSGVQVVDFRDGTAAKDTIDAWVQEQTAERIDELFPRLPPDTELVLANAVYLKADWKVPFAEEPVRPAPFTLADGTQVQAPTMGRLGTYRFAQSETWQAVEIPYEGEGLAMWILLPAEGGAPADLLAPQVLAAVDATLEEGVVDLQLPQWDFAYDLDLIPPLVALGLDRPFSSSADFSGITTDTALFIEQAVHRATITVDEWGTEAAAVTGLAFPSSGPPEPDAVIHADRPFAFLIRHLPTGAPLFFGQVADPTETR